MQEIIDQITKRPYAELPPEIAAKLSPAALETVSAARESAIIKAYAKEVQARRDYLQQLDDARREKRNEQKRRAWANSKRELQTHAKRRRDRICALLKKGPLTSAQIAVAVHQSVRAIHYDMRQLHIMGKVYPTEVEKTWARIPKLWHVRESE